MQPRRGQRHLDRDIVGDAAQHLRLAHHPLEIERHHLGGHGAFHHARNLFHDLEEITSGFVHQAWVGGDAVKQPRLGQLTDLGYLGRVGKELHWIACVLRLMNEAAIAGAFEPVIRFGRHI